MATTEELELVSVSQRKTASELGDKSQFYLDLADKLWVICPPVIIIGGTIGNILSAMVASRKDLRSSTVSFFLIALALVDTLPLWIGLSRQWLRYTFDVDIRLFSNFGCKLHKFLVFWNGQTTALVLIVMTTERFITISFPHQTRISITKKKLACFLIMLSFCAACLTSHYWWTYSLYEQHNYLSADFLAITTISPDLVSYTVNLTQQENVTISFVQVIHKCSYQNSNYIEFISQYWTWINLAVYSIIPFLIIITLNLLLLIRLSISVYERKKRLGQMANTFTIGGSSLLLISAGLLYLFCTGPIAVFHIFNHVWRQHHNSQLVSDEVQAQRVLMRAILENISYLTNALNILVYCISGSRFRKELILMLKCKASGSERRPLNNTLCKSTSKSLCKSASSLSTFVPS